MNMGKTNKCSLKEVETLPTRSRKKKISPKLLSSEIQSETTSECQLCNFL